MNKLLPKNLPNQRIDQLEEKVDEIIDWINESEEK